MTRAVLAARVSTDDKGQTCDNQLLPLRSVAERNGWQVARELRFEGQSAWDPDESERVRKAVLAALQETGADTLMVAALDRIYRGPPLGLFDFMRELDHLKVVFYSIREEFLSTATLPPALRDVVTHLFAYVANLESEQRSARLRASYHAKQEWAKNGSNGTGHAKWGKGYVASPRDIEEVKHRRAAGETYRQIAAAVGLSKSQVGDICNRLKLGREAPTVQGRDEWA